MEKIVKTYRDVAKIPDVVKATLLDGGEARYKLQSTWTQRDLERSERVKFVSSSVFQIDASSGVEILGDFNGEELNKELLCSFSHCGNKKAVIREVLSKDSKPLQYLEIWYKGRKTTNVNLTEVDKHDTVISYDQFSSFKWSHDDSKILYIAEKKERKTCSFFNLKKKEEESAGDEHVWKESWGEQQTEAHCPTLCIFDVESERVSTFDENISDELSVGQAVWAGDNVIFVGWKHVPYRLGLQYCPIRESGLFFLNPRSLECKPISADNVSVRSPRVHPDGKRVFYMENSVGGPHMPCARLMMAMIPLDSSQPVERKVVVDIVRLPKSPDHFHGIYAILMPDRCFSRDGAFLFMSTIYRSHMSVISVDLRTGDVKTLTKSGFYDVKDVYDDIIVASYSTPISPPEIVVAKVKNGDVNRWHVVVQPGSRIENMSWEVVNYIPDNPNPDYPNLPGEYIIFRPTNIPNNKTLIVFPHGGPHSVCTTSFTHSIVAMCQLGFTVVQINYRGSIGFGQDGIDSLPGRVGKQDVLEVQQVAESLKAAENYDHVFVTGGSHGGFLSLQLISQFPEFYLATCVRNPVVSMPVMCGTCDIPDWNYCESLQQKFDDFTLPIASDYDTMLEKSPVTLIKNAKAPCLMMLGECDLRVPPSQGLHWAKLYRALGRTCKVLMYKDNNHPISKVDAEADVFVNTILWFLKYRNPE